MILRSMYVTQHTINSQNTSITVLLLDCTTSQRSYIVLLIVRYESTVSQNLAQLLGPSWVRRVLVFAEGWWTFTSMTAMTRCASTLVSLCMVMKRCPTEQRRTRPTSTTSLLPAARELEARTNHFVFSKNRLVRSLVRGGKVCEKIRKYLKLPTCSWNKVELLMA